SGRPNSDAPRCPAQQDLTMQRDREAATRHASGLLLTEFGASDVLTDVARVAALAGEYMVSWHYWAYGDWLDPTGNPGAEGMFADDLDRPASLKQAKADLLIRTYPQAVAGTPQSFAFDPVSKEFTLSYPADPSILKPTTIF